MDTCMPLLEFGAVTIAAMWAFIIATAAVPDAKKFVSRAFWAFALVHIGADTAAMAVLAGLGGVV